ncbi:MAG: flagellar biosynthetic protein FliO [Acidobacteriota bacterium]
MSLLQIVSAIVLVFSLMGLLAWLGLRMNGSARGRRDSHIRVLERLAIGDRRQLLLVEIGGRRLLLGSTSSHISVLARFDASEMEGTESAASGMNRPSFASLLEMLR